MPLTKATYISHVISVGLLAHLSLMTEDWPTFPSVFVAVLPPSALILSTTVSQYKLIKCANYAHVFPSAVTSAQYHLTAYVGRRAEEMQGWLGFEVEKHRGKFGRSREEHAGKKGHTGNIIRLCLLMMILSAKGFTGSMWAHVTTLIMVEWHFLMQCHNPLSMGFEHHPPHLICSPLKYAICAAAESWTSVPEWQDTQLVEYVTNAHHCMSANKLTTLYNEEEVW